MKGPDSHAVQRVRLRVLGYLVLAERDRQDVDAVVDGVVEGLENVRRGALPARVQPACFVAGHPGGGGAAPGHAGGHSVLTDALHGCAAGGGGGVGAVGLGPAGGEVLGEDGGVDGLVAELGEEPLDVVSGADDLAVAVTGVEELAGLTCAFPSGRDST